MSSTSYPFDAYSLRSSLLYIIFNNTSSFTTAERLTMEERHSFYKKLLSVSQYRIENDTVVDACVDNRALFLLYTRSLKEPDVLTKKESNLILKSQDIFMNSNKHKEMVHHLCNRDWRTNPF